MGRNIPSSEASSTNNPALALPLLAACIAATIAILATLCIFHQKSSSPKSQSSSAKSQPTSPSSLSPDKSVKKTETSTEVTKTSSPPTISTEVQELKQSPPTPEEKEEVVIDVATHGPIGPTALASAPRRKLSVSLSMKLPEGLSKIRTNKKERQEKPTEEESVWMKTIILGERCKVPSDDEEEVVIYDEKRNKQRNYHPKTPRSLPVSRTNSFANVEVVAS